MTCCEQVERQLGRYIDGELPAPERAEVDAHLEYCSGCRGQLDELRAIVAGLKRPASTVVPDAIWSNIERRLDRSAAIEARRPATIKLRTRFAPWALAAAIVLPVGVGIFGVAPIDSTAQATTLDFRPLLDALPLHARKAFRRFLVRYNAKPVTPIAAKRSAPDLNFDTPATLPGGFQLNGVYELKIGDTTAIAAAYDRNGEFLAAVFHPPMKHRKFGRREDYDCVIGAQCGHRVQVGEWKLVHLTDPTTCHCLLSRLDETSEMPAVMRALAPDSPASP